MHCIEPHFGMLQPTIYQWCADVRLSSRVNDSSDWLRRNDSYTQTFCNTSNLGTTEPITVEAGKIEWFLFFHSMWCDL